MSRRKIGLIVLFSVALTYIAALSSCGGSPVDAVKESIEDKKSELVSKLYPPIDDKIKRVEIPVVREGDI